MKNFIKKYFKILIGVAVLLLCTCLFFFVQRAADLENGNLRNWAAASGDSRIAAVKILTGADDHIDLMVACLNKMATLPDSGEMPVRDAAELCYAGIRLRENL